MSSAFDIVSGFLGSVKPKSTSDFLTMVNPLAYTANKAREGSLVPATLTATKDTAGLAVHSFLSLMGEGVNHVTKPAGGFLAKHDIDPNALLPLPRDKNGNITPSSVLQGALPVQYQNGHVNVNPLGAFPLLRNEAGAVAQRVGVPDAVRGAIGLPNGTLSSQHSPSEMAVIQHAPSNTAAFNEAEAGHPFQKFAFESIYDPLNWIGLLAGGAGEAGTAANAVSDASRAARIGDYLAATTASPKSFLQEIGNLVNRVQGAPIEGVMGAAKKILEPTGLLEKSPNGKLAGLLLDFVRGMEERQGTFNGNEAPLRALSAPVVPPPPTPAPNGIGQYIPALPARAESSRLGQLVGGPFGPAELTPKTVLRQANKLNIEPSQVVENFLQSVKPTKLSQASDPLINAITQPKHNAQAVLDVLGSLKKPNLRTNYLRNVSDDVLQSAVTEMRQVLGEKVGSNNTERSVLRWLENEQLLRSKNPDLIPGANGAAQQTLDAFTQPVDAAQSNINDVFKTTEQATQNLSSKVKAAVADFNLNPERKFVGPEGVAVEVPRSQNPTIARVLIDDHTRITDQSQIDAAIQQANLAIDPSYFPPQRTVEEALAEPSLFLSDLRSGARSAGDAPHFLTADDIAQQQGLSLTDPTQAKQASDLALQQLVDTPANDPRWRYVKPTIRTVFGKESLQPALSNANINRTWNETLHEILHGSSATGSSGSLGFIHPGMRRLLNLSSDSFFDMPKQSLPQPLAELNDQFTKQAQDAYDLVLSLPGMKKATTEADKAYNAIDLILEEAEKVDPTLRAGVDTSAEVVSKLQNLANTNNLSPELLSSAEELIGKWGVQGLEDAKVQYRRNMLPQAYESLLKHFDITGKQSSALSREYGWLMSALKATALATPRNPIQDTIDAAVKTGIVTHDPLAIIQGLRGIFAHGNVGSVTDQLAGFGEDALPGAVGGDILRGTRTSAPVQGIAEEFKTGGHSPFRRFQDAPVIGNLSKAASAYTEFFQTWRHAVDSSFRSVAYAHGYNKYIDAVARPAFMRELESRVASAGLPRASTDQLFGDLMANNGKFSAQDVTNLVQQYLPDRTQLANALGYRWKGYANEAVQAGIKESNRVHFDYSDIRNIDELLNKVTFFHFWSTRNIPFYAKTFAENPWLLRAEINYSNISSDERNRTGNTQRTQGKLLGIPIPTILGAALLGGGGKMLLDPMVALTIYDQTRSRFVDQNQPAAGRYLDYIQRSGLSPNPIISEFLNAAGIHGNQEPQDVFRYSGILRDVTQNVPVLNNIRPEHWLAQGLTSARATLTGQSAPSTISGSAYEDYAINKQIREMAYQMTGNSGDDRFAEAMADPSNPIYQAAKQQVENQNIVRDLYSLIVPIPMTLESNTESLARQSAASLPQNISPATLQTLRAENSPASMYWSIPQNGDEAQIRSAQALGRILGPGALSTVRSRDPVVAAMQGTPDALSQIYAHFPAFQRYTAWRSAQPEGSNTSVNAFIGNLATQQDVETITNAAQHAGLTNDALAQWLAQNGYQSPPNIPHDQVHYVLQALKQLTP